MASLSLSQRTNLPGRLPEQQGLKLRYMDAYVEYLSTSRTTSRTTRIETPWPVCRGKGILQLPGRLPEQQGLKQIKLNHYCKKHPASRTTSRTTRIETVMGARRARRLIRTSRTTSRTTRIETVNTGRVDLLMHTSRTTSRTTRIETSPSTAHAPPARIFQDDFQNNKD